ncbi:MAG: hypothetical protein KF791_20105 [Verrucomicrobiae bacterium]|nr:hypothetical protein [Verrucomicrobiae bacterium]
MSWGYGWRPYVSVAQRRANAAKEVSRLAKKGRALSPVHLKSRTIATTFWGRAWCDNLESYSDFENRLPRGRTYVRNGSVVDLQVAPGRITALVSGSSMYEIVIQIHPLSQDAWRRLQKACSGQIDSLIEMLQGRLSAGVMQAVTRKGEGLFPKPAEIQMKCSCPDWAGLCKHVAASLYGVGARLDEQPELLFQLRGVDPADLIAKASASEAIRQSRKSAAPALSDAQLSDVFGIELDTGGAADGAPAAPAAAAPKATRTKKAVRGKGKPAAGAKPMAAAGAPAARKAAKKGGSGTKRRPARSGI